MGRKLFGAWLRQIVPLSSHDIAEIVEEQAASGRRFGEVALSLRMCRPHHVWQAWWEQLGESVETVDLDLLGIDTQAMVHVPASAACEFVVIPLRVVRDELILAATPQSLARAAEQLPALLNKKIRFVQASEEQIASAIERYYPAALIAPTSQTSDVMVESAAA